MKCKYGDDLPEALVQPFPDVPLSHWAANAMAKAKADGVVRGYPDGTARPKSSCDSC